MTGRWWQERLVRELTWVSAFEQDDAVLSHTIQRLSYDKELTGVAAGIEALLLFRLKREWKERREYSVLQEQLQLSTTLGKLIHIRPRTVRLLFFPDPKRVHQGTAS